MLPIRGLSTNGKRIDPSPKKAVVRPAIVPRISGNQRPVLVVVMPLIMPTPKPAMIPKPIHTIGTLWAMPVIRRPSKVRTAPILMTPPAPNFFFIAPPVIMVIGPTPVLKVNASASEDATTVAPKISSDSLINPDWKILQQYEIPIKTLTIQLAATTVHLFFI